MVIWSHQPWLKIGFLIPGIFQHVLGFYDMCCFGSFFKSCFLIWKNWDKNKNSRAKP